MSSQMLIKDLLKSFVPFAQLLEFFPLLVHGRILGLLQYLYEFLLGGLLIPTITPILALIILYLWTLAHEV
jgi:hypothetical protein